LVEKFLKIWHVTTIVGEAARIGLQNRRGAGPLFARLEENAMA
jgi:hypothetical protein